MKKVSKIDFSKHELKITKHDGIAIYEFKKPGTVVNGLTFTNAKGVLTVTGDFGNWVFCREFHPSPGESVSRCYWDEKLEILSVQKSDKFDSDETLKRIRQYTKDFKAYSDRAMNEEEKEWVSMLKENVYDEFSYTNVAYREKPSTIEYEEVPFGKKRHFWLDVVYDAFNEICSVMKRTIAIA